MAKNNLRWLCQKTCPFYKPRENKVCGAVKILKQLLKQKVLSVAKLKNACQ